MVILRPLLLCSVVKLFPVVIFCHMKVEKVVLGIIGISGFIIRIFATF